MGAASGRRRRSWASPPAAPLVLASTSPRRRQILEQLRIPFEAVPPRYDETEEDPVAHALGKARSVLAQAEGRPVLGCDTEVVCEGRVFGKPQNAEEAEQMLERLAGRTHEVVSGLTLLTPAWEEVHSEVTLVTFRSLTPRELAHYVASGEWEGRAGGYAIQGQGARSWSGSTATTSTSSACRRRCSSPSSRGGFPAHTASDSSRSRAKSCALRPEMKELRAARARSRRAPCCFCSGMLWTVCLPRARGQRRLPRARLGLRVRSRVRSGPGSCAGWSGLLTCIGAGRWRNRGWLRRRRTRRGRARRRRRPAPTATSATTSEPTPAQAST